MKRGAKNLDLTTGPAVKKVFILSAPLVVSNLMHVLYNMVDTAWLGVLGKNEVAAMAFVFPVIFLVVSIGAGIGIAGSILVAQYEGAGDSRMVNFAAGQTLIFSAIMALAITFAGYFSGGAMVRFLGASLTVAELAESYLKVIFPGIFFMFAFFVFNALMRGWGNTRVPMNIMIFSNIINIVLDPVFIFGFGFIPAMGIKGAALSTVLSRLVASVIGIYLLFKGGYALSLKPGLLKPDVKMLSRIFSLGWPATIEHAMRASGMMAVTAIVAVFGTVYVAAYGIGARVLSFFIMPSLAVSMGVSAGVGQNLGAGFKERARKITVQTAVVLSLIFAAAAAAMFAGAGGIMRIFISGENVEVISRGAQFLRRLAVMAPFVGSAVILRGGLKGAGRTLHSMLLGMIGLWIIRIPLAYVMAVVYRSPEGVWNSFLVGGIAEFVCVAIYFMKVDWAVPLIGANFRERMAESVMPEEEKSFGA
ncbi:MAG: MATE family efflux transporter [Elusimicrobia bacterium]|nr:MATE family efflux transporter [Elusimicrobiota bacterium]